MMDDINKKEDIAWTDEALRRVENAPDFVKPGIKKIGFEELKMDAFDKAKEKLKSARKKEVVDDIKDFLSKRTSKNEAIIEKFRQYLEDDSPDMGWTKEARERMEKVPSFVREMAKKAIEEHSKKKGYRMITVEFLKEALNELIPPAAR